jgi:hypothetical protein
MTSKEILGNYAVLITQDIDTKLFTVELCRWRGEPGDSLHLKRFIHTHTEAIQAGQEYRNVLLADIDFYDAGEHVD